MYYFLINGISKTAIKTSLLEDIYTLAHKLAYPLQNN